MIVEVEYADDDKSVRSVGWGGCIREFVIMLHLYFFFCNRKTAYEFSAFLVRSGMCIRDSRPVPYRTVRYRRLPYGTVRCSTVPYGTVWYSTFHFCTSRDGDVQLRLVTGGRRSRRTNLHTFLCSACSYNKQIITHSIRLIPTTH